MQNLITDSVAAPGQGTGPHRKQARCIGIREYCATWSQLATRALTYTTNKKINYADWRLELTRQLIRVIPIAFVAYTLLVLKEQKGHVTTQSYFDLGVAPGSIRVNDILAGPSVRYDVSSILIKEDEATMFVPTVITSRYQVYKRCPKDALNPGIACAKDTDCRDYYNQANATCGIASKQCSFQPSETWCTINSTTSTLFPYRKTLTFTAIARITCKDNIFSNYHRSNPRQQYYFSLNAFELLRRATQYVLPIKTQSNNQEYFKNGADLVVIYSWYCDLALKLGRYDCPIKNDVELLSSTAQTSRALVTALSSTVDGQAARQHQQVTGIRFRLESRGGCYQTTFSGALGVLVKGFTLDSLGALLMACIIIIWHWWYRVPRATETFVRVARDGEKPVLSDGAARGKRSWAGLLVESCQRSGLRLFRQGTESHGPRPEGGEGVSTIQTANPVGVPRVWPEEGIKKGGPVAANEDNDSPRPFTDTGEKTS